MDFYRANWPTWLSPAVNALHELLMNKIWHSLIEGWLCIEKVLGYPSRICTHFLHALMVYSCTCSLSQIGSQVQDGLLPLWFKLGHNLNKQPDLTDNLEAYVKEWSTWYEGIQPSWRSSLSQGINWDEQGYTLENWGVLAYCISFVCKILQNSHFW